MNNNRFRTKIIYIVVIIVLLIPLYILGRPASLMKGNEGQKQLSGGVLADIRLKENIVDAQLGNIDPGSSTMKLATFGMRGVALVLLWHKSLEFEKKSDWNNVVVTSNQITMLEPRFTTVWDFLGWRLAYNASRDQDDLRERYRWVIRGYEFLEEGIHFNEKAPFLYHKAGWTISQKIGIADEKVQYRQLFRLDDEFHKASHIPYPGGTPSQEYRDNWLFGRPLYLKAEKLFSDVENDFFDRRAEGLVNDDQFKDFYENKKSSIGNMARPLFFVHSRMNLIHYANWYEQDGGSEEKAIENWRDAQRAWDAFGKEKIRTTINDKESANSQDKRTIYLNEAEDSQAVIDSINHELVSRLAPRTKKDLYVERWNKLEELEKASLVNFVKNHDHEQYVSIREYLDENRPLWQEELTALRNSIIDDPDERIAYLIPDPIRKGARGEMRTEQLSDDRDEINMAQKAGRQLEEVINQASRSLILDSQRIASEIGNNVPIVANPENPLSKLSPRDLVQRLEEENYRHRLPSMFCELTNYIHYGQQIKVEMTRKAVSANHAKYKARLEFNENKNYTKAKEYYLESMRLWRELMDDPEYSFLTSDIFRRDFMEFVDRLRFATDRLVDPTRGNLYPIDFPFDNVVRIEFDNDTYKPFRESLDYLRGCYTKGDFDEVADRSLLLLDALNGFMAGFEYLQYVPVQEYKDDAVEVFAMYINAMQKTGREFSSKIPLLDFINTVMFYEPITLDARNITEQIFLTDDEGEKLLTRLTDAASSWKLVVDKFPILKLETEKYDPIGIASKHLRDCRYMIYDDIIENYMFTCKKMNRQVTTAFPLYELLPAGTAVIDSSAVFPTIVAPVTNIVPPVESVSEPVQEDAFPAFQL